MYQNILELFINAFGVTSGVPFVTFEVLATLCCVFIAIIPFVIVWRIILIFIG